MKMSRFLRLIPRAGLLVALLSLCMTHVTQARAETMTLLADTTMVTGTQSAVFSFTAPSSGTVTATLDNLNWQKPLSSLSFMASSGTNVMSSWMATDSKVETFQVTAGNYFAHILATTADNLDVGRPAARQQPAAGHGTLWNVCGGARPAFARILASAPARRNESVMCDA
jgi:hypothetical protein